jgi:hypothetical protein
MTGRPSRNRRKQSLPFTMGGVEHRSISWRAVTGISLGTVDRATRLVDVHDPAGHLVAVLATNGEASPPLLYASGSPGPYPTLALVAAGLVDVMTDLTDPEILTVGALGTPRGEASLHCPMCDDGWPLRASDLRALAPDTPQRRVPRLILAN